MDFPKFERVPEITVSVRSSPMYHMFYLSSQTLEMTLLFRSLNIPFGVAVISFYF